jgi:MscS family membrane protein
MMNTKTACPCVLIYTLLMLGHAAPAQSLTSLLPGLKNSATEPVPTDPLKRTTPRSSILNFFEACHSNNFVLASAYLDLRRIPSNRRAPQGAELARELAQSLDRDPKFEVHRLSDNPQGDLTDGLPPDIDNLDSFQLGKETVMLQMQRQNQHGMDVWLVSADTVARIPELSALAEESGIEKRLPQSLVTTKFIGTPVWIWLALLLMALILSVLARLLSRVVIALVIPLVRRYAKSVQPSRFEAFAEPLRLLVSLAVFRACMEAIAPSALARDYLLKLLALLFIFAVASLLMRIVDVVSDHAVSRLDPRQRSLSYSVFPLFVRIVKIFILLLAGLVVLARWGYPTSTILAGVGVGGIAIALAAQKTIENLFGSLSIIADRPVLVGDFCQFGTQTGTVEDIGLRSTRLRTQDRTVVTIPNSVFSTMTLENYSRRDRIWFHPTLRLRRDTTPDQINDMMDAVTKILQEHPVVDASGVPLRFTKIGNESFEVEIFSYVLTADYNEYLRVQSELLLKIVKAASRLNIGFPVPLQESLVRQGPPHEPDTDRTSAYESDLKVST